MRNKVSYSKQQKNFFAFLVNILVPLAGISTDIYLPSLPAISVHFGASKALAQFTVAAFVLAMGISQLIVGPISDSFGRKKLLVASLLAQLIATVAIIFSPNIYWMLLFRFIQGLGAAFMMVPIRAVIVDVFEGAEIKKQFNYTTISFALSPILAPFVGGYIQQYLGWQANFYFLTIYALFALIILIKYKETIPEFRKFSLHHLWKNYHIVLQNKYFVLGALLAGITWGYSNLFGLAAPFLVQMVLHKSPAFYGHIALLVGIAWFIGNSLNRVLFNINIAVKSIIGLTASLIVSIIFLILAEMGYFNIATIIIPTFIILILNGMLFPIYVGECLMIFTDLAASANACLFSIAWFMYTLFAYIASLLKIHSLAPLALTYIMMSASALIIYFMLRKIPA